MSIFNFIYMSFEKYEPKFDIEDTENANKLFQKSEKHGVNTKELADGPANPTNVEKEKTAEEKSQEQKEKQEKQQQTLNNLQKVEGVERQSEIASANQNLNQDMWPPISFDDTDSLVRSQIGKTEGGTSVDTGRA